MFAVARRTRDRLIGLLVILAIVFAGAAWYGGDQLQRQLLLDDASDRAARQAIYLENRLQDLDRVLAGRPTPEDQALIEAAMGAGGALDYEILDADGVVVRASERGSIGSAVDEAPFWDVVQMGDVHATLQQQDARGGTRFVTETYVPFVKLGRMLGAIRVHADTTARGAVLATQIRNAQLGIVALWLLLGGFYAWTVARTAASNGWPHRNNRIAG